MSIRSRMIAALGTAACALAAPAQTPLRANATLAVRSTASATATQIGSVPSGHVCVATEKSGTWWRIFYDGRLGFVSESSVTTLTGVAAVKIVMDGLYVRSGPANTYTNLGSLPSGEYYALVQTSTVSGWYEIYWGGRRAYVPSGTTYVTKVTLPLSTPPAASSRAFLWPVSAWVTATNYYRWGDPHDGSADLATPYWSPIGSSRSGRVSYISSGSGYGVSVDHGGGYKTHYHHLAAVPPVAVGDSVAANQVVGYVGRTGYAHNPHCHFELRRWGTLLLIPNLSYGMWVARGGAIPGTYVDLTDAVPPAGTFGVRVLEASLDVRAGALQSAAKLGAIAKGTALTAYTTGAANGYYRISYNGGTGYVVMTGVEPAISKIFGGKTTASTTVRSGPGTGYAATGTLAAGTPVTVFENSSGWYRILDGYPTVYRWIAGGTVAASVEFDAMISAAKLDVMSGPGAGYALLGTIALTTYNDIRRVYETNNGWYRINFNGKAGWIPGWRTAGRI